jgi:SWI/SNF-related matrix-associated actin-dependent regulator of chromatin subfamily A member 5
MSTQKSISSNEEFVFSAFLYSYWQSRMIDDIEAIIQRGEEQMVELNNWYKGLNFEESEASVQQWEGEDYRRGVRSFLHSYRSLSHSRQAQKNFFS